METKELPLYQSHKQVRAVKIKQIVWESKLPKGGFGANIIPEDEAYGTIRVDSYYMQKHNPKEGGYYVKYEDGYESWSPAEAFEAGNTLVINQEAQQMNLFREVFNKFLDTRDNTDGYSIATAYFNLRDKGFYLIKKNQ